MNDCRDEGFLESILEVVAAGAQEQRIELELVQQIQRVRSLGIGCHVLRGVTDMRDVDEKRRARRPQRIEQVGLVSGHGVKMSNQESPSQSTTLSYEPLASFWANSTMVGLSTRSGVRRARFFVFADLVALAATAHLPKSNERSKIMPFPEIRWPEAAHGETKDLEWKGETARREALRTPAECRPCPFSALHASRRASRPVVLEDARPAS
jgi:hypothetical protein